jgi:hypothetical protein
MSEVENCSICICSVEYVGNQPRQASWGQRLHNHCALLWIRSGRNTCPLCRPAYHVAAVGPVVAQADGGNLSGPARPQGLALGQGQLAAAAPQQTMLLHARRSPARGAPARGKVVGGVEGRRRPALNATRRSSTTGFNPLRA